MSLDPSSLSANWNYPTAIKFGPGRIAELGSVCKAAGIARPLLVTDAGLAKLPMVAGALRHLADVGLEAKLFCDIMPNPVAANVIAGVGAFKAGGHDGVVALGGGSALDAGKAIAFLSGQSRPIWDFEDVGDNWTRADPRGIAPTVAVPTTAGTGSEVGRVSVITDAATHTKRLIFHPRIMPVAVIGDPALTLGVPPHLTAATGMDALAHCLEAYCAPGFHPMADGIAVEGLRLMRQWLPIAYRDGSSMQARAYMLVAATMGAVAFQKGLGAVHSLSHPIGAMYGTHHGLLNAVLMPYVLAFNRSAIGPKMDVLAQALGLPQQGFDGVAAWIAELCRDLAVPRTLAELGIDDSKAEVIARAALADPTAPTNPVQLEEAAVRALFLQACRGN
ncbi:MAG: iron-containing alcohol dehydrogenase [Hyphomonadaceae bacterium]|jgi:alcohol dehydrogenase class IV|nr:iron-containing alcohol dehydrogenase [Hyphomonadaceae bacterium]